MSSYVALLRGVNVGRTKRMAMQELRDVLGAAGLTDVRTLLQSGNVIFEADSTETAKLAARLEEVIADGFAMEVPCVVCTASEMKRTISANPLPGRVTEGSKLLVTFLSRSLTAAQLAEHDPRALAPATSISAARSFTSGVLTASSMHHRSCRSSNAISACARRRATGQRSRRSSRCSDPERRPAQDSSTGRR